MMLPNEYNYIPIAAYIKLWSSRAWTPWTLWSSFKQAYHKNKSGFFYIWCVWKKTCFPTAAYVKLCTEPLDHRAYIFANLNLHIVLAISITVSKWLCPIAVYNRLWTLNLNLHFAMVLNWSIFLFVVLEKTFI